MVGVAQLVELRIVTPAVVGSNPIVHPNLKFVLVFAEVVKLVDTLDLGSSAARRESSSLSFRTSFQVLCLSPYAVPIIIYDFNTLS